MIAAIATIVAITTEKLSDPYSQIIENGQETTTMIQRTAMFNPLACYKCACLNAKLRTRET